MTYYDHAANQLNPGRGKAIHDNCTDAKRDNTAYRVEFGWKSHGETYWLGNRHDATELAEELYHNNAYVRLLNPNEEEIAIR